MTSQKKEELVSFSPTCVAVGLSDQEVEPISLEARPWKTRPMSEKAQRTTNPIRRIVDPIVANIQNGSERGDGKDHISLALGDPTAAGNLPPCPAAIQAIQTTLSSKNVAAGYVNACGAPEARQAVARFHDSSGADSVILANGCSGALELALTALLDTDSILLVPQPGFPLYQVICESHGAKVVHYRLLPDQNWECDLQHIRELMLQYGDQVRGILINNPSNPTGAVFSLSHLQDFMRLCEEYQLPVVADEVYGDLTFANHTFHPLAKVAKELGRQVPVITASGIGKQYLLPGWRVGWIVFHDNVYGSLKEVEAGAKRLAQVILGASHLAQTAVPVLLDTSNVSILEWKQNLRATLEEQADYFCKALANAHHNGLQVMEPGGAMYAMIRIDPSRFDESIQNDLDFSKLLLEEENVFMLPGTCFGVSNVCRVVFCAPPSVLQEAADRIQQFCQRHAL